jgi:protein-tyrosine phosphatase
LLGHSLHPRRSSDLELALARRLGIAGMPGPGTGGIVFGSAGTHAHVDDPMHRYSARTLAGYGASTRPFRSRRVDRALLSASDLVLTATRDQRAHCVRLAPAVLRRTFTVREFGRLCGAIDPADRPGGASAPTLLLGLVESAVAARARFQPVPARDDDLGDPVNQPLDAFQACAQELWSVLDVIAGLLTADRTLSAPSR